VITSAVGVNGSLFHEAVVILCCSRTVLMVGWIKGCGGWRIY